MTRFNLVMLLCKKQTKSNVVTTHAAIRGYCFRSKISEVNGLPLISPTEHIAWCLQPQQSSAANMITMTASYSNAYSSSSSSSSENAGRENDGWNSRARKGSIEGLYFPSVLFGLAFSPPYWPVKGHHNVDDTIFTIFMFLVWKITSNGSYAPCLLYTSPSPRD